MSLNFRLELHIFRVRSRRCWLNTLVNKFVREILDDDPVLFGPLRGLFPARRIIHPKHEVQCVGVPQGFRAATSPRDDWICAVPGLEYGIGPWLRQGLVAKTNPGPPPCNIRCVVFVLVPLICVEHWRFYRCVVLTPNRHVAFSNNPSPFLLLTLYNIKNFARGLPSSWRAWIFKKNMKLSESWSPSCS